MALGRSKVRRLQLHPPRLDLRGELYWGPPGLLVTVGSPGGYDRGVEIRQRNWLL